MKTRKLVAAAALTASVAGGAAGGALLFTPSLSGAQTSTSTTAPATTTEAPRFRGGMGLDAAATALGITTEELRTAIEGGKTIAQVAADEGVAVQKVIDAMVAEAQEGLEERITAIVNGELPLGGRGGPGGHGHHGGRGLGLEAAATVLDTTVAELRTQLQDGKTLAEIAGDKADEVIDAIVAERTEKLDEAVAAGRLTEAEATERKADLKDDVTAIVNGERPAFEGRGGPRGMHAEGAAYDA